MTKAQIMKKVWVLDLHTGELKFQDQWIAAIHLRYYPDRFIEYNPKEGK